MSSISLLIKPASGNCNMRCSYCFYFDEMQHRTHSSCGFMNDTTIENIIKKALSHASEFCAFAFQGGEPMLAGLDFYKNVVRLQNKHNKKGVRITNALQTNGTLITPEFAEFFGENNFLIGVSMDGYEELHDANRKFADKTGTFDEICRGVQLLEENNVDFNILTVLHSDTARNIKKVFRFLLEKGYMYQQYIAHIDPMQGGNNGFSLSPLLYAKAIKTLFDLWYKQQQSGNSVSIRYFDNLAAMILGYPPESCDMRGSCASNQYSVEADGSVYPCDFYMLDEYKLGNINADSFSEFDSKRTEIKFVQNSLNYNKSCNDCRYYKLCRGGCVRYRNDGLYAFCEVMPEIFDYIVPKLRKLAGGG